MSLNRSCGGDGDTSPVQPLPLSAVVLKLSAASNHFRLQTMKRFAGRRELDDTLRRDVHPATFRPKPALPTMRRQ